MEKNAHPTFPSNDALQVFSPIIGNWDTTGSHGMIPDTVLHGRTSFDLDETKGFIRVSSNIQEEVGIPAGIAIIASDDELGTYLMSYYDVRGISRIYNMSMQDNVMKWWRDAPSFSQRYSLTVSEDQQTMVGKGEIRKNGSAWEKDLDLTYKKVES
jgi:hypothetical protein